MKNFVDILIIDNIKNRIGKEIFHIIESYYRNPINRSLNCSIVAKTRTSINLIFDKIYNEKNLFLNPAITIGNINNDFDFSLFITFYLNFKKINFVLEFDLIKRKVSITESTSNNMYFFNNAGTY